MVKNNRGIVIGYSKRHTENYQFLQEIKSTQRFVLFYLNYSTFNWVLLYSFSLFSLQKIEHFKQQVSGWHRVILILYKFLLLCVVQLVILLPKENRKQHYYHSQSYSDSHYIISGWNIQHLKNQDQTIWENLYNILQNKKIETKCFRIQYMVHLLVSFFPFISLISLSLLCLLWFGFVFFCWDFSSSFKFVWCDLWKHGYCQLYFEYNT